MGQNDKHAIPETELAAFQQLSDQPAEFPAPARAPALSMVLTRAAPPSLLRDYVMGFEFALDTRDL